MHHLTQICTQLTGSFELCTEFWVFLHDLDRMSRDQRAKDNWALLHACELAAESGAGVAVAFNLVTSSLSLLGSANPIAYSGCEAPDGSETARTAVLSPDCDSL